MRLHLFAAAAIVAAAPAIAQAQPQRGVTDPRAFVAAQYAAYRRGNLAEIPATDFAYSQRLAGLFRAYDAAWTDGVGALDFDWWIAGQDWEISEPALTQSDGGPDRRTITARFTNFDTPNVIQFRFVREGGRWYLDDAVNAGPDGWALSAVLAERP